ncbi:uncharacterized protein LOC113345056 [Papaver somniferum]|uniref:uncharacterized protein LOC113345056 n=1 Tax=Papaver somniferum TaxID=3469 RepID=UPI000E6F4978|nr:uncharacterized protein LOC113345056 [Papaver somniferum]
MRNIQVLREEGVPQSNIVKYLVSQPMALSMSAVKLKDIVQEIKGVGFDPHKFAFLTAIGIFKGMAKSTWEAKLNAYRKWAWSEEEILFAFRMYPTCIAYSTKKISLTMDYLINHMDYSAKFMARYPTFLGFSLEKRIIPRCSVYRILVSKGLIKDQTPKCSLFRIHEDSFLEKFVIKYEKEAVKDLSACFGRLTK